MNALFAMILALACGPAPAPTDTAPPPPRAELADACAALPQQRASVQYVGRGEAGGDGSFEQPFGSLTEALRAVQPDTELRLTPGVHSGLLLNDPARHRRLSLVGCGEGVEVDSLFVVAGSPHAAISDVAIVNLNSTVPIELRNTINLVLRQIEVRPTTTGGGTALRVDASRARLEAVSVVQRTTEGVYVQASDLTLDRVQIHVETDQPEALALRCEAATIAIAGPVSVTVDERPGSSVRGWECALAIHASLTTDGGSFGVYWNGGTITMHPGASIVLQDTDRVALALTDGARATGAGPLLITGANRGLEVARAEATLSGPIEVTRARTQGVWARDSDLHLSGLTVRDSASYNLLAFGGQTRLTDASLFDGGLDGIAVGEGGKVTLEGVLLQGHARAGLLLDGGATGTWQGGAALGNAYGIVEQGCTASALDLTDVHLADNADNALHACDGAALAFP